MADKHILDFQALCKKDKSVKEVHDALSYAVSISRARKDILSAVSVRIEKPAMEFMEYQRVQSKAPRSPGSDRIHPLDTVTIQSFNTKHGTDVKKVLIHSGPAADELARSMSALAVTIADDIYFRNSAYRPESEEGRMLLAHELTHVYQYEHKRISKTVSTAELETEAQAAEHLEQYTADPDITVLIYGKLYTFPKSQMEAIAGKVAENVVNKITQQRNMTNEREYLKLLGNFQAMTAGGAVKWLS